MRILGIETSCDETAVSLIEAEGNPPVGGASDFKFRILGDALLSQIITHAQFGGVVPNLAKREHGKNLTPLLSQCLADAQVLKAGPATFNAKEIEEMLTREPELYSQLSEFLRKYGKPDIDCIAITVGPGLEPALWVGVNFAHALSLVWNLPVVAVNHMEGHIVMSMMEVNSENKDVISVNGKLSTVHFPLLSLLISGGHTELVLSQKLHDYKILGATRDDAVGEAFDKVARLLGFSYPGGAELSRLAGKSREQNLEAGFKLPRPMLHGDNLDFSFAGIKTAVLKIVEANSPVTDEMKLKIAREFEDAVTDVLVGKTMQAVNDYGVQTVLVGGGVSANKYIRLRLTEALEKAGLPAPLVCPPQFATDNALMIALAGYFRATKNEFANPGELRANGNLKLV